MNKKLHINASAIAIESGDTLKVLPMGEIKGRDGRYWVLTPEGAALLISQIKANGVDIVIDYAHGSYLSDRPEDARAAGWLKAETFEVRDDGIYAQVTWTDAGRASIESKEFRYLSPTFWANETQITELESVGLVNIPNIATLPALNNRQEATDMNDIEGLRLELNELKARHGAIEQELNAVKTERDGLLRELNEARGRIAAMEAEARKAEVEQIVNAAITEGRIAPAQRETCLKIGMQSKEDLEAIIKTSPLNLNILKQQAKKPGGGEEGAQLTEMELNVCKAMGLTPEQYFKHKNVMTGGKNGADIR